MNSNFSIDGNHNLFIVVKKMIPAHPKVNILIIFHQ